MDRETQCKDVNYRFKIKIPVGVCVCGCAQTDKLLLKFL